MGLLRPGRTSPPAYEHPQSNPGASGQRLFLGITGRAWGRLAFVVLTMGALAALAYALHLEVNQREELGTELGDARVKLVAHSKELADAGKELAALKKQLGEIVTESTSTQKILVAVTKELADATKELAALKIKADDIAKEDLELFQGHWTVDVQKVNGKEVPDTVLSRIKYTFSGNQVVISATNQKDMLTGRYTIDSLKDPKQINLQREDGKIATHGIYRIHGDTLRISVADIKEERPRTFEGGNATNSITLKRLRL